ncbi:MAG: ribosomal protein S18-alanine N-acetyltransferase [Gaiellaceae bacterium]|jgi:ribosomal-protein-alanine N-acetyltransferase
MSDPARESQSPLELAPLEIGHLDEIEAIERRSYPMPWSRAMFAGELFKSGSLCLGAFRQGRLIGYLIVSRYVDAWHVMNLAVDPGERRRGVATRLLAELFKRTDGDVERGYTLEVRPSNGAAIRLYERLGFRARGVRRGYYLDNHEDALVMWKGGEAE